MVLNLLILGAGWGTRLSPLTNSLPKALLPLETSETILLRIIKQLQTRVPISNIWVNVSAHALTFLQYLVTLEKENRPRVILEPKLLGAANTLFEFSKFAETPTLVIHGDLVLSDNYVNKLLDIVFSDSRFLLICHRRNKISARSQVSIGKNCLVTGLNNVLVSSGEKTTVLVNSGIYFFPNLDHMLKRPEFGSEIADSILQTLIHEQKLYAVEIEDERISVDSLNQLDQARKLVMHEKSDR